MNTSALHDTYEALEVRRIRMLHDKAETAAYEFGRYAALDGRPVEPPFNLCDMLAEAYKAGWADEKAGKP